MDDTEDDAPGALSYVAAGSCAELTCGHITVLGRFRCPQCGKDSSEPYDLRHGYCGNCKAFTTEPHGTAYYSDDE